MLVQQFICIPIALVSCMFQPSDILFARSDLARRRTVLVRPGNRIFMINDSDTQTARMQDVSGNHFEILLPQILHQETIPKHQHDNFMLPSLPNVTIRPISIAQLIKPIHVDTDEPTERRLAALLKEALKGGTVTDRSYANRLYKFFEDAFRSHCIDNPIIGTALERKMRAVLSVLGSNMKALAWLVERVGDMTNGIGGYFTVDELALGIFKSPVVMLRLHIWHDFPRALELAETIGQSDGHDHGYTLLASALLVGSATFDVHLPGGDARNLTMMPCLTLPGKSSCGPQLNETKFQSEAMHVKAGEAYLFPPRWVHAAGIRAPGDVAVSLELRIGLGSIGCGVLPRIICVRDSPAPEFLDWLYDEGGPSLRRWASRWLTKGLTLSKFNMDTKLRTLKQDLEQQGCDFQCWQRKKAMVWGTRTPRTPVLKDPGAYIADDG